MQGSSKVTKFDKSNKKAKSGEEWNRGVSNKRNGRKPRSNRQIENEYVAY